MLDCFITNLLWVGQVLIVLGGMSKIMVSIENISEAIKEMTSEDLESLLLMVFKEGEELFSRRNDIEKETVSTHQ